MGCVSWGRWAILSWLEGDPQWRFLDPPSHTQVLAGLRILPASMLVSVLCPLPGDASLLFLPPTGLSTYTSDRQLIRDRTILAV